MICILGRMARRSFMIQRKNINPVEDHVTIGF